MIKSVFQAAALLLVAVTLSSCALAQMPARMLQAVGRTMKMADAEGQGPATSRPIQIQQREIEQNRVPAELNPVPAMPEAAKMENRVADGAQVAPATNPS